MRLFNLYIFLLCGYALSAQNTIGLPEIKNFKKQQYKAGTQTWDIAQNSKGILFFANNEGLLTFDGNYWKLHPLPNKTIVRSIAIDEQDRIFVGGQDELGYFSTSDQGHLTYHSLLHLIPSKHKILGDIWDIVIQGSEVFFRSDSKILQFNQKNIIVHPAPNSWAYLGKSGNQILAQDVKLGLMQFESGFWKSVAPASLTTNQFIITSILQINKDSAVITTLKSGIFILSNQMLTALKHPNNQKFSDDHIYAATKLSGKKMALGTTNNGMYIIESNGSIVQHFSKTFGLQNSNVLSVFEDFEGGLWLGLDNGIDYVAYNSAIKHILPQNNSASGYTCTIYKNQLFVGTSNGLYQVGLQNMTDLSFSKGDFSLVSGTKGQNWTIQEINNKLLLGHHDGAFEIKNNKAHLIAPIGGFWNFEYLSSVLPSKYIAAGTYNGIEILQSQPDRFVPQQKVSGFHESSRFLTVDDKGDVWVSHPIHGIYRISQPFSNHPQTIHYTTANGLPAVSENYIFKINQQILASTSKGIYEYAPNEDLFKPSIYFQKIIGRKPIRYVQNTSNGTLFFVYEKKLAVVDTSNQKLISFEIEALENKLLSGFEMVYPYNDQNIFLAAENGIYHLNLKKYTSQIQKIRAFISAVKIGFNKDSTLSDGYQITQKTTEKTPRLHFSFNNIRFEFSSPNLSIQSSIVYSYRLKGLEDQWSNWQNINVKEYTNLPAGKYSFQLKVKNALQEERIVDEYHFEILPPWYLSTLAKIFYLIMLLFGIYKFDQYQRRKFKKQKAILLKEQERLKYINELEKNKNETLQIALENEKLTSEIKYKNAELASSAMHLVKKGELLDRLKTVLNQLLKNVENDKVRDEIKSLIKSLQSDSVLDEEWEKFSTHFDTVHSSFLTSLKEKHPQLTSNDHKLCAYLRMNLSTKEIAQLMNISVRGVEISRYRLRKKLGLTTEQNLYDYLMEIHH